MQGRTVESHSDKARQNDGADNGAFPFPMTDIRACRKPSGADCIILDIRKLTVRVERPPVVHGISSGGDKSVLDKSAESGIIKSDKYSFQKGVTREVQAAFDEEYALAVSRFGPISTISHVGILNDRSTDWGTFNDNSGELLIRNANKKDCLAALARRTSELYKSGEWSSPNVRHVIRHEIAHAIQLEHRLNDPLWDDKLRRIIAIYDEAMSDVARADDWNGYKLPSDYAEKLSRVHI